MHHRLKSSLLCSGMICLVMWSLPRSASAAQPYKIDPVHSFIVFNIKHLDLNYAWGRTAGPTGTIAIDDADPAQGAIEVQVPSDSIDTGHPKRNQDIKGPDFFDVKQFPHISFKSQSIKKSGDNTYEVSGEMNLHGVTKPLTVTLTKLGEGDKGAMFGHRAGFGTEFTIKRSDFGMTAMPNMLGDEVKLFVNLEAVRQ